MKNIDLNNLQRVHFIGIGGIGVSAIARMMMLEGKQVSGSDSSSSMITDELLKLGVEVFIGHNASNINSDLDLVVYTIAIPSSNPELVKATELGISCLSYPEVLGQVSKDKYTIAVAGTHGKTTTTGMLAKIFLDLQLDPTVVVGSFLKDSPKSVGTDRPSNFIAGQSKYFIAEACEYRRSFLNLEPNILIITNIEEDHLDYYQDLADIQDAFKTLAQKVPADGFIICNTQDPNVSPVIGQVVATVLDYSDSVVENLHLKFPGSHMIDDAKATLQVVEALGLDKSITVEALNNFSGTWRRFDYQGQTKSGADVYDDYAHHPQEITKTLQAGREKYPQAKLVAVFQPHLFSRTKEFLADFAESLTLADEVVVLPIYAAREQDDGSVSAKDLVDQITHLGTSSVLAESFAEAKNLAEAKTTKGDVIFVLGAGDVIEVSKLLVSQE